MLLGGNDFIPHGHCYRWQPTLIWLHLVADTLIALTYYAIPVTLVFFAQQRQDISCRWVFWLFGAFMVASGTAHLLDVWTLWHPTYWLAGGLKLVTALLSLAAAVTLFRLLPQALALPSFAQWETANSRLRQAERMAGLGNWDYDLRTQIVTWSEALFGLFGLPVAPVAPSYDTQLQWFQPESQAQLDQAIQTAARNGTPYTLELQLAHPDGATGWLLARGEAVRDNVGKVVKLVGTALDITERKQLEEKLRALNQLKDDFLSAVSHELRSPLASIKLSTYMLELNLGQCQPPLPDVFGSLFAVKVSRYLQILQTECERELNLVNELLELQRLEAEAVQPDWSRLQLSAWLPDLVAASEVRAASRDLTLELKVPESLPNLVSDAAMLTSVLRELLTNACKYTPPGGTIVVQAEQTDSTLQLLVSNTGTVVPPDALLRLFEKFYRLPGRDRWQQGGTGLGLTLAKQQVECLGGTLQVTSDDDQTVFCVELPLGSAL